MSWRVSWALAWGFVGFKVGGQVRDGYWVLQTEGGRGVNGSCPVFMPLELRCGRSSPRARYQVFSKAGTDSPKSIVLRNQQRVQPEPAATACLRAVSAYLWDREIGSSDAAVTRPPVIFPNPRTHVLCEGALRGLFQTRSWSGAAPWPRSSGGDTAETSRAGCLSEKAHIRTKRMVLRPGVAQHATAA